MIWKDVEQDFLKLYPHLQTGCLQVEDSTCQWFFLPEGYRNQKNILTFGFLKVKSPEDFQNLVKKIEMKAQELGVDKIIGPLNLSTYLDYRVKLDYFEDTPYPGEPKNPDWLAESFKNSGFEVDNTYFSNEFKIIQPRIIALALYGFFNQWKLRRHGYRYISLTQENVFGYLDDIHKIVHEIFFRNHLYVDIPHEVFLKYMHEKYFDDLHSRASYVVLNKEGRCVGFTLNLHDRGNPSRLLFKTIGVHPDYSHHGRLMPILISKIFLGTVFRNKTCMACLAIETKAIQKKMASVAHKTMRYALYYKKI